MRYCIAIIICTIFEQSIAQELLLVPNSSINGFSYNPAYTFHHTPRFVGMTHHFQSGISNGIQSTQVIAGTPLFKSNVLVAFSGLADRIGTTNQALSLSTTLTYRLTISRTWKSYAGLSMGVENQERFWPDYIDRYNFLQPSSQSWNIPDSSLPMRSIFTTLHTHLALTGPKIFLGLHVKNWNTPMDAINTKVNVRVEYVMGYTFYTKLGRITPLLTLSNYPSPGLSNPKNTNTFGLNINYHYLRWISGFGVRKSDLASFHTQLGYEFKSLTVMYNVGISPIASTVLEGNRSTFHQMTAQWNLFPSKKEKLPYYFLDHFDYPNGKLKILKLYNYGQLIEIEKFHDNGELMESMHFKDGLLNGEYSFSNKSGDSTISGQYINGKKYGEWMKCISNPPDLSDYEVTYNYLNDLLHGEYYIEKEGDILVEGMYHMGYKHGEWLYFNKNGKHIKTEKYSEGVLVE